MKNILLAKKKRGFYHLIVSKAPKIFEACLSRKPQFQKPRSGRPLASNIWAFGKTVPIGKE